MTLTIELCLKIMHNPKRVCVKASASAKRTPSFK
jgi:hypothetical protein